MKVASLRDAPCRWIASGFALAMTGGVGTVPHVRGSMKQVCKTIPHVCGSMKQVCKTIPHVRGSMKQVCKTSSFILHPSSIIHHPSYFSTLHSQLSQTSGYISLLGRVDRTCAVLHQYNNSRTACTPHSFICGRDVPRAAAAASIRGS